MAIWNSSALMAPRYATLGRNTAVSKEFIPRRRTMHDNAIVEIRMCEAGFLQLTKMEKTCL
ncbi:hypothetical protein JMJ77_0013577 [Colletotrichum scovillei]|uniref:Uncharacterized protein n=1 Tax=Colletotrichum scovillei TaxID=1209932 RepID=A0A9P7UFM1_9PEZI|nr:hypothetical protein JMJ77_0013577 [Colletotrichum scovillei]KAG7069878.1 hypothetical protein JMJ76_0003538 [Colletotrichum scovillei]KAG7073834.1 hypothetical protein JMJ78_0014801 [Colletotrichum scovillei]